MKFLKKRYEFISIDIDYVKTNISVKKFPPDDQSLLILIIIILKNANNLILELGSYSFMQFLKDISNELLHDAKLKSEKTKISLQLISEFTLFKQAEQNEIS